MPDCARTVALVMILTAALLAAPVTVSAQTDAGPSAGSAANLPAAPAAALPPSALPSAPAVAEAPTTAPAAAPESLLIGPGDLLQITVLRESELDQKVRVLDSGAISLELAGNVAVQGLTPAEAAARIEARYRDGKFLLHPEVSVLVEEYATQTVTVLGQVAHPGTVRLTAPRTLIDVLSLAGGLDEFADRHIVVERKARDGQPAERIRAYLPNRADDALNADILVHPGDTVIVPKAGIVYVLGDVAHPGGYVMQNDSKLTVLQAIALAAGTSKTASERKARLVRTIDGRPLSIELPLHDMERGREPDVPLQANDIVYVPFSVLRNLSLGLANITAAASSALIYATQ
ncbi:MAG TPA: polysaccharide biosynthesis/export family protein [Acidobacteriaceae bacterium]|nr:polysaccharide biosynthesis/export family protein [Acidobacteriaceae bacterium]